MPTPNEYDISRAFKRIENDLMESMVRNLKRHRAEEDELGIHWEQWQALQIKELERYRAENADKFTGDFAEINKKIGDLYANTYNTAQTDEESVILHDIIGKKFQPKQVKDTQFFALNDEKLNVLLERTQQDFVRAEYAVLRRANDAYRSVIFDAQVYANVTNDYNKAVDMATHDFIKNGFQSIQYKNGARHNISDYARMAIRTGNKRAYLMGEGNARDKYGIHTVRVNRRTQACPLCVGYLGRVLVDDVYGGGTAKEAFDMGIPTLSSAMQAGFLHPNCKDIYSTYIEGISQPAKPWTQDEINKIVGEYNEEQALKHAQDMADSYSRLAKYALDPDNAQRYQARADNWYEREYQIKNGLYVGAPQVKVTPAELLEPVAPIFHEGIRALLTSDIQAEVGGIVKINSSDIAFKNKMSIGDLDYTDVELKKKITIPWDSLSDEAKMAIEWNIPQRYKKDFLIQPKDLQYVSHPKIEKLPASSRKKIKSALDNGYTLFGQTYITKYNRSIECFIFEKNNELYFSLWGTDSKMTVSDDLIEAIKSRQKIVSKQLWDEGVRFSALTERQGDNWVNAMQKFHTAIEADKPVTLVSRAQYDNIKGEELYRGIAPVSHLRSDISMTKTPFQCGQQLMEGGVGDCFPSRGVYGDVIAYLSNSQKVAFDYATGYRRGNAGGCIARMKIKEDARVISYDDAKKLFNAIADKMGDSVEPYFSRKQRRLTNNVEVGKAMQMLGYDVIYEPRGDGMDVHFYMVLNREAIVAVKDEWALVEKISEAQFRRGSL